MNLYNKTQTLLARTAKKNKEIAKAAGVSESWLDKFKSRAIPGGDVHRVQSLHDYLAAQK